MNSNKNIWIGAGVVILLVGVYFVGQSSQNNSQPLAPSPAVSTQTTTSTSTPQLSNEPVYSMTSIDQKSIDQGYSVVLIGANPVTKGSTTFSDTITDLGQNISGSNLWAGNAWGSSSKVVETTAGHFVQVDLTINNIGMTGETIQLTSDGLFDQAGRRYSYLMGNSSCSGNGLTESDQILSPDIPCVEYMLFETGESSKSYTLKLFYKKTN